MKNTRRIRKTMMKRGGKKNKTNKKSKKIVGAIESAEKSFKKTGSLNKARLAFRAQALANARKLFGYTTTQQRP